MVTRSLTAAACVSAVAYGKVHGVTAETGVVQMAAGGIGHAGGFDQAIEAANARVVKLYGVGAGLQAGYGTGVVVSPDGLVLTVSSLLIDARSVRAVDHLGRRYVATTIHRDLQTQLALLRLAPESAERIGRAPMWVAPSAIAAVESTGSEAALALLYFDLSAEAEVHPGDWVVAVGNAFKVADGAERLSVAHGVFSARTRLDARRRARDFPYHGDVLVIDAITSNPGFPGGALVNLDGAFLGMLGRLVTSNLTHTHFNYAIPRDVLLKFLRAATAPEAVASDEPALREPLTADREAVVEAGPDLGIRLARVGYLRKLPFVERVQRGSPAERAGVRTDDLILSVAGRSVATVEDFDARLRTLPPGEPVDLVIRRGQRVLTARLEPRAE